LCFTNYHFGDQVKESDMSRTSSTHRRDSENIRYFCLKTERKRPLGRPRRRREDNIKMYRKERRRELDIFRLE
jgi:hypothetical protein